MAGTKGHSGGRREGAGSGGQRPGAGRPTARFTLRVGDHILIQREHMLSELWRIAGMDRTHLYIEVLDNDQVVETLKVLR